MTALTLNKKIQLLLIISFLSVYGFSQNKNAPTTFADKLTIYRDSYGVPHIYGDDDSSAAFGFAYAQAEDNFERIEKNFIEAVGRSTELRGKDGLLLDWVNRAMEIVKFSKMEYDSLSPSLKAVCDGYAEGLNYYLKTHPEVKPILLSNFEPWYPLALIRLHYYERTLLGFYSNIPFESFQMASEQLNGIDRSKFGNVQFLKKNGGEGSNTWAVNGKKSASGNALLFINPHIPFFGSSQVYEAHIMSKTGWNFSGYTRFGFPFPYVGFGENIGWSSTDNEADVVDAYIEDFDWSSPELTYRYDGTQRTAHTWKETINIHEGDSIIAKELSFISTHHGPVLAFQDNSYLSVKMAKYEEAGWLEQWYLMTKAQNLEEFREATSRLDVLFGNYTYADVEGNIWYVYNAAVPKRSEKFDWTQPVDGSTSETEWQGYHSLDELPQVLNPTSGWIQNCNGTPLLTTKNDNPTSANYPSYMVVEPDNYRSEMSRRILDSTEVFTYESFAEKSYTTYLLSAEKELPELFKAWDLNLDPNFKNSAMAEAIEILRNWDKVSTIESIPTTLYIHWAETLEDINKDILENRDINLLALQLIIEKLNNTWGSFKVPWGDINRLQRFVDNGDSGFPFNDSLPSLKVAGTPHWTGSIFTFETDNHPNTHTRYGVNGNSYVSVIEFGPTIKAGSLIPLGTSADPTSPHYFDQAEIYTKGHYKKAYLTLEEVEENAIKKYKPGKSK